MEEVKKNITFRVQDTWVMISELFGDKVTLRATKVSKPKRVSDTRNQHRCQEMVCEGTVRVTPKRFDISNFTD